MTSLKWITISLATTCALSCATSDAELDEQAVAEGADDKADSISLTRLERATPTQVTTGFAELRGMQLAECFDAYKAEFDPTATKLTKAVADKFISVGNGWPAPCSDWSTLSDVVDGVLDMKGVTEATVAEVVAGIPAWAKPQLVAASVSGHVQTKDLPIIFYYDLMRVRDANAMVREKNPAGVDLKVIRAQWDQVRDHTTLDRAYLNPVTFPAGALEGDQLFKNLRAAFPLRALSYISGGYTAVSDFAAAGEGPEGDPAFAPIATAFRKRSIKKRFYFARTGEWSSNVLIVVDEHGQAYGMQMGYSE